MISDELVHAIRHVVAQAAPEHRPFVYGHIASYDPSRHRVRCILPSMQDDQGLPLLSPWMPMGSLSAGAGYGIQIAYRGGATVENPTAGEQVLIGLFDQRQGVSAVPAMHFHDNALPPATALPQDAPPVSPGDVFVSNPSKTMIRIHANGDFEIFGTAKLIGTFAGDASITTNGNATVTAQGKATVIAPLIEMTKAAGDALMALCTDAFRAVYNAHTHPNSGPPSPQATAATVTSILKAE